MTNKKEIGMVDRNQLVKLQNKARNSGMECDFIINKQGQIDSVSYCGTIYDPLVFAEKERKRMLYK
jgi:hypothetical protein